MSNQIGKWSFNTDTSALEGITSGNAIPAGQKGEIIQNSATPVGGAANVALLLGGTAGITVTPGLWYIFFNVIMTTHAGDYFTAVSSGVSTTNSGYSNTGPNRYATMTCLGTGTGDSVTLQVGPYILNTSTSVTLYGVASFLSNLSDALASSAGSIQAVRIA
jgi:hypothetical protein